MTQAGFQDLLAFWQTPLDVHGSDGVGFLALLVRWSFQLNDAATDIMAFHRLILDPREAGRRWWYSVRRTTARCRQHCQAGVDTLTARHSGTLRYLLRGCQARSPVRPGAASLLLVEL